MVDVKRSGAAPRIAPPKTSTTTTPVSTPKKTSSAEGLRFREQFSEPAPLDKTGPTTPVPPPAPGALGWETTSVPEWHLKTQSRLVEQSKAFAIPTAHADNLFPPELKGKFAGTNLIAVGDGDWYHGWDSVEYRLNLLTDDGGKTREVFDPRYLTDGKPDLEKVRAAGRDPEKIGKLVTSLDATDVRGNALVLSPNRFHVQQIEQLVKNPNVTGVYVEKPMATNLEELKKLDGLVAAAGKPMYFGDHYVFAAAPLFALMGKALPGENLVQITSDPTGRLKAALDSGQPLLHGVKAIDAKTEFPGDDNLLKRSWLQKASLAGGVQLDLQVHLENVIHQLGFEESKLDSVERKVRPAGEGVPRGTFVPIDPKADQAEDFAHVKATLEGGAKLNLEVAQYVPTTDNHVTLTGDDGCQLKMDLESRVVQYLGADGAVLGEAKLAADPVLLMMNHALGYFASGDKQPVFYEEQRASIRAIEAAKAFKP
jgi:predicted dehydrogenase